MKKEMFKVIVDGAKKSYEAQGAKPVKGEQVILTDSFGVPLLVTVDEVTSKNEVLASKVETKQLASYTNSYEQRLQREAEEREERMVFSNFCKMENKKMQEKMNFVKKYSLDIDGVPMAYVNDAEEVQEGDVIVIKDGYDEYNVLTVKTIKDTGSLEGKRVKYTMPSQGETQNAFFVDGNLHYFETKLSKNQVILTNGELFSVKDINKETKEVDVEKKESKKMTALYGVYTQTKEQPKKLVAVHKYWGQAYGEVLEQRFGGHLEYQL